jgi:hypothetical protein
MAMSKEFVRPAAWGPIDDNETTTEERIQRAMENYEAAVRRKIEIHNAKAAPVPLVASGR